ncbi:MAG: HAD family hydrolase [Gemmiger sp.]|nr:HAD family hydrolase [Gemmiger sp.]
MRLIASDVDGTLLPPETQQLNPEIFTLIDRLAARGILFCAASGRQYSNLRRLFAPVADKILYCCENGAVVYYKGRLLAKTPLPRPLCEQLTGQLLAEPGCEVVLSGADTAYLLPKSEAFLRHMRDDLGNHTVKIAQFGDIQEDILKVSASCDKPAAAYEALFAPVWNRHLNVAISGRQWLDFTLAHKGTALSQASAALAIPAREMVALGDNFNDIPMFRFAGYSYAMANAAPAVRAAACAPCADALAVLRGFC